VEAEELGRMLGKMPAEDAREVINGFLETAAPEAVGAVVGWIVAHLAQRRATAEARSRPRNKRGT
jgi:hypothetical protein